jgi:hypothetical protein
LTLLFVGSFSFPFSGLVGRLFSRFRFSDLLKTCFLGDFADGFAVGGMCRTDVFWCTSGRKAAEADDGNENESSREVVVVVVVMMLLGLINDAGLNGIGVCDATIIRGER